MMKSTEKRIDVKKKESGSRQRSASPHNRIAAGIGMGVALMSMVAFTVPNGVCAAGLNNTSMEQTETTQENTETETDVESEIETETETEASQEQKESSLELQQSEVFDMSTAYPGITVKPGETTSFKLDFMNYADQGCDVALSIQELPEGWKGFFRGDNGQINKVHIGTGEELMEALATLSVTVPEDTKEGTYKVVLRAETDNGETDDLLLELNVNEEETGVSTFTAEYPEQQAASGTSFSFDTTLVNNRGTQQSYSLSAKTPEGWQVGFTPSGESSQVASMAVEAGSSKGITVSITPPETLTEGEYTIPISAISSSDNLSTELKITITGSYQVSLSTPTGNLSTDAYANDEKAVTLSITNTGNVDLTNLNLTSSAPSDWEVRFDQSDIDLLEAGSTKEITAYIKPNSNAITGDYVTSLTVSNNEATSTADFRVSVKTRTSWGIFAAAVVVVLAGVLGAIVKKYGRR